MRIGSWQEDILKRLFHTKIKWSVKLYPLDIALFIIMIWAIMRIFTWRQRAIVFGTTAGTIALFLLIGAGIDRWLGSEPIGLVIGLIASYPFTQYFVVKRIKKQIEKEKVTEENKG